MVWVEADKAVPLIVSTKVPWLTPLALISILVHKRNQKKLDLLAQPFSLDLGSVQDPSNQTLHCVVSHHFATVVTTGNGHPVLWLGLMVSEENRLNRPSFWGYAQVAVSYC